MTPTVLGAAIVSITLNALAQIALRKAMLVLNSLFAKSPHFGAAVVSTLGNYWLYVGLGCYAVSIVVWLFVLSRTEVSLAYPLLSIGYIIGAVIGYFFLGESVGTTKILGIGIVCAGIVVMFQGA